jgi:hypothetical protein
MNTVADLPTFRLRDEALWNRCCGNNTDDYGWAVQVYAAEWASRMDRAIDDGGTVEACAERCSREADDVAGGVTGFMYGCAVSELSAVWDRGEELRRWHNLREQIGREGERANEGGGVLNPALVNFGELD